MRSRYCEVWLINLCPPLSVPSDTSLCCKKLTLPLLEACLFSLLNTINSVQNVYKMWNTKGPFERNLLKLVFIDDRESLKKIIKYTNHRLNVSERSQCKLHKFKYLHIELQYLRKILLSLRIYLEHVIQYLYCPFWKFRISSCIT